MAGCQAAWIRLWQTTQQVWARLAWGGYQGAPHPLLLRHLSSSTSLPVARTDATAEVLIAVADSQAEGNLVRRLEISLPPKGGSPCHSYASDASLRDVQFEHSGRATYGDPVRGKRGRCPSGSPATSAARAWRDRLQARAARGFAPSNGTRQNTVAQIHAGGATPPRRSPSVGETATPVTERSWECLWLTPGRSLLLRLFVSSILRLSEDVWFLHLCKIGRLLQQSL